MIALILTLALVGLLVYLIQTYIPMPAPFKLAITVVAVICVVLYLLRVFGLDLPVPRVH